MELAVTAFLRLFVAKHGPRRPEFLFLIVKQSVAQSCSYHARRRFGAQRQALAIAIGKGIHFLCNDIRLGAYRALEQLGEFQQRQAYFGITV